MQSKPTILFEALANVLSKKSAKLYEQHVSNEDLLKTYSSFMMLRYLTMSANEQVRDIVISNYISLERLPPKAQYRWLLANIPKQASGWIKYLK